MASEPRVEELLATIRRAIDHDINELDRRAQEGAGAKPSPSKSLQGRVSTKPKAAPAQPSPPIYRASPPPVPAASLRGTLNDFRDKYVPDADADIAKLRQRVRSNRFEEVPLPPPPRVEKVETPPSQAFSSILSTPQRNEPIFEDEAEEAPQPEAYPVYEQHEPVPDQHLWQPEPPEGYYPPAVHEGYAEPQPGLMSPDASYAAHASFQALAQLAMSQVGGDQGLQHMTREVLTTLLREWLDRNLPPLVEALVREEIERVARGRR